MRSCFPRDQPSTASWWAAIVATYAFKVEGDSLRSNLSCRKESTTPIMHLRGSSRREEHSSRTDSIQCVGLLVEGALAWVMVSTTAGGRPLKSAASRPGATHGGSIDRTRVPYGAKPLREEILPQRNAPGRWGQLGKWVRGNQVQVGQCGATSRTCLLVLPELAQCLCE